VGGEIEKKAQTTNNKTKNIFCKVLFLLNNGKVVLSWVLSVLFN
jgi:hypothetical protein